METVKVVIEGTSPLLLNRFTDEAAQKAGGGGGISVSAGDRGTPFEQSQKKLYTSVAGDLIMPQPNIFRCLIDAGTFFKSGKSKVTTQKTSLIPACISMNEVEYVLQHREPWTVDSRAVCNPSTGGRLLCHRPKFEDWKIEFELEIDTEFINVKLVREIVDAAGKRIGLGDFRPARKGPFGKFVVTQWSPLSERNGKNRLEHAIA